MCIYSCMAHQIKDAHPHRQSDYVGPTCVQDISYMYNIVFIIRKALPFLCNKVEWSMPQTSWGNFILDSV